MLEKTIYVADDGTEFHTPDACLEHEEKQKALYFLLDHPDRLTVDEKSITAVLDILFKFYNITKK